MTLIVEDADKKTRVVGMKWVKLGEGKDPEFDEPVFLYNKTNWKVGYLKGITKENTGKVFMFMVGDTEYDDFTHYCIPKPPTP